MNHHAESVSGGRADGGAWKPIADVVETNNAYSIEVELPGVRREDVNVSLEGNDLVVSGEVTERKREGVFRHRTRKIGHFDFRVTLPGALRDEGVELSMAYGVLKVFVPKANSANTQGDRYVAARPSSAAPRPPHR